MTNRDYILKTCPYDLLIMLNDKIYDNATSYGPYMCFVETMRHEYIRVKETYYNDKGEESIRLFRCRDTNPDCSKCIQRWLNEDR